MQVSLEGELEHYGEAELGGTFIVVKKAHDIYITLTDDRLFILNENEDGDLSITPIDKTKARHDDT